MGGGGGEGEGSASFSPSPLPSPIKGEGGEEKGCRHPLYNSSFPFSVQARDWYNNLVTGYTGQVHFSSTDRFDTFPADTTLANGVGTFSATLRSAGSHTIWAADVGAPSITGSSEPIEIVAARADLSITKSHKGKFKRGQKGAVYTIRVTNGGAGPSAGKVKVVDALPSGLQAIYMGGPGWSCNRHTLTCTRFNALAAGTSYPPITLSVTVSRRAPSSVTNVVTVSGGGDPNAANNTASDPTTIVPMQGGGK